MLERLLSLLKPVQPSRDWTYHHPQQTMRRWTGTAWEYRAPTVDDMAKAYDDLLKEIDWP